MKRPQADLATTTFGDPAEPKALVARLRRMTTVGEEQYEIDGVKFWSDEDLDTVLQRHVCARLIQTVVDLMPSMVHIGDAGGLVFLDGRVRTVGTLDVETALVQSWTGGEIVGEVTVHDDGRLDFTENQASTIPVLSGPCYDLDGAAADVLGEWASALMLGYDIKSGDASLPRSQRHAMLLEQAAAFRARAVAGSAQTFRGDVRAGRGHSKRSDSVLKSFRRWGRPG